MAAGDDLFERLTAGIPRGFLRNLRWQYVATLGSTALGGLYFLLLGHSLGLVQFGIYSLCLSIATLTFNCADLRLQEVAIRFLTNRKEDMDGSGQLGLYSTLLTLFLIDGAIRSLAALLVFAFAKTAASIILHDPSAARLLVIAACILLLSKTGNGPAIGVLRILDRFEWTAWLGLADWTSKLLATALIAGLGKLAVENVLVVALVCSGTINFVTIASAFHAWRKVYAPVGRASLRLSDRGLWRFIGSCYGISLSDSVVRELDTTIVGWLLSVPAAGLYRMSKNFVQLVWRFADPVFLVVMPEFSRLLSNQESGELRRFLVKLLQLLGIVAIVLFVASAVAMPWIVQIVLGRQFAAVSTIYPIMASFIVICMPLIWTHALLAAAGRADLQLRANISGNIVGMILLVATAPILGVYGASMAYTLGLTFTFGASAYLLLRSGVVR